MRIPTLSRGLMAVRDLAVAAQASALGLCLWFGSTPVVAEPLSIRAVTFGSVAQTPLYSAPATVVARNEPSLAAEVDARVVEIPVEVGERVASGALLARFDCRRYASLLSAAAAERDRVAAEQRFATAQLIRARDLKRKKSISEETLDQRRTDLAKAKAAAAAADEAVRQAGIDVGHCELRAPFAGVVTAREASVGDFVSRGVIVVALLQISGQEVSVALRHGQADSLAAAGAVQFEHNERRFAVDLRALLPLIDPTTRTREARLAFVDEPAPPGAAGRLLWQGGEQLLPADFLVRRGERIGVFLVDGGLARFRPLPDAQDGRPARVDLAPETLLISDGRQRVGDGDPVRRETSDE